MRSDRAIRLVAVADAVLLAFLIAGLVLRAQGGADERPLLTAEPGEVTRITFEGGVPLSLVRLSDGWEIVQENVRLPARPDRVSEFVEVLASAVVGPLVSDSVGASGGPVPPMLGVDEAEGRRVTVVVGDRATRLVFGTAVSADAIYMRREGSDAVFEVRAPLGFYLDQSPSYWAYLRLFPESARPQEMIAATVGVAGSTSAAAGLEGFSIVLGDGNDPGAWELSRADGGSVRADSDAVRSFARQLVDLVGSGFYIGSWETLVPLARLSFSLADGRSFAVEVRTDGQGYIARPEGPALPMEPYGGLLYEVRPASFNRLTPLPEEMLATEAE